MPAWPAEPPQSRTTSRPDHRTADGTTTADADLPGRLIPVRGPLPVSDGNRGEIDVAAGDPRQGRACPALDDDGPVVNH
jgi:hypothetical protein